MAGLFGYLAAGAAEGVGTGIVEKAKAMRDQRLQELERGFRRQERLEGQEFSASENEKNRNFQLENRQGDMIDLGGGKYGVRQGARVEPLVDAEGNPVEVNVPSGYRQLTPDEVKASGLDPSKGYQVATSGADKGKISQIGGGGVNVQVGGQQDPKWGDAPADQVWLRDASGEVVTEPDPSGRGMRPVSVPIAGSKADLETEQAAREAEAQQGVQAATDLSKAETMLTATSAIKELMESSGTPVTGTLSKPFAMYSGSAAGKVRSYVRELQSGVALNAIMRLKEASAQGATGFGAMNEKELQLLIDDVGALDADTTDPEIFAKTIDRIDNRFKRVVEDVKRNVSPERIKELGLEPLIASVSQSGKDVLPDGVTEEDIEFTMKKYGMTREQVLERVTNAP